MIHAGVADSRQWNNEFVRFADRSRVLRYDMRGYGRSEPVEGEFSNLQDLAALLDFLRLDRPVVLMGCSMGGGLALDFALERPSEAKALILVGSGPRGLELDVPTPDKFAEAEEAYNAGDLDRVAEIETQIWFDGEGRTPDQVDPAMRRLAYEMNRIALDHEAKHLGRRLPDTAVPGAERLSSLQIPLLIVVGGHDTPYILAAADHMMEQVPSARKAIIPDAAHMPNMDHPEEFQRIVTGFLDEVGA
jgi:pimeloyl-ACP methyl ester carboxylesterase